jgi:hypothetical protein
MRNEDHVRRIKATLLDRRGVEADVSGDWLQMTKEDLELHEETALTCAAAVCRRSRDEWGQPDPKPSLLEMILAKPCEDPDHRNGPGSPCLRIFDKPVFCASRIRAVEGVSSLLESARHAAETDLSAARASLVAERGRREAAEAALRPLGENAPRVFLGTSAKAAKRAAESDPE